MQNVIPAMVSIRCPRAPRCVRKSGVGDSCASMNTVHSRAFGRIYTERNYVTCAISMHLVPFSINMMLIPKRILFLGLATVSNFAPRLSPVAILQISNTVVPPFISIKNIDFR